MLTLLFQKTGFEVTDHKLWGDDDDVCKIPIQIQHSTQIGAGWG
jgi:hypothetical protein